VRDAKGNRDRFVPLPTATLSAAEVLAFRDYAFDAYFKGVRLVPCRQTEDFAVSDGYRRQ
jgi:hypothetical protein